MNKSYYLRDGIRFLVLSVIMSLVLTLLFSVFIKLFALEGSAVNIGRIAIKTVAIILSSLLSFRCKEKGLLRGAVNGLTYAVVTTVLFSALSGQLVFSAVDVVFALAVGTIGGFLSVNMRG